MNKEVMHEYEHYLSEERKETEEAYKRYREQGAGSREKGRVIPDSFRDLNRISHQSKLKRTINRKSLISAAAAILILALVSTVFLTKDKLFGPKYTEEQIALSYEHSLRTLAEFSKKLSSATSPIKTISNQKD